MESKAKSELIEIFESRKSFYDLLAMFYREPLTQDQIDSIVEWDFDSMRTNDEIFNSGLNDMFRYLRKRNTGTRQALATDYTMAFTGAKTYMEKTSVPCASIYVDEEGTYFTDEWRRIKGIYKTECFRLRPEIRLPEDHLSFELEFLGLLSEEIIHDIDSGDSIEAKRKIELSLEFIDDCVLSWFDSFETMAGYIVETRFYRGVIRLTHGYLNMDREILGDVLNELNESS